MPLPLTARATRPAVVSDATAAPVPDLVVLSHLRWPWVWQRPQHLVSRMAAERARVGARTWFVEEPTGADVAEPELAVEEIDGVQRVLLRVPHDAQDADRAVARMYQTDLYSFDDPAAESYGRLLLQLLTREAGTGAPDVLIYTPMAYGIARQLGAGRLAYDVMDDLASFANAPRGLRLEQQRLLADADVVFAGGRSLHRSVAAHRKHDCYLFPSGVDRAHYASSISLREPRHTKVAGYVGVVDERLDLDLLRDLAGLLPDWTVRVVGPLAKINPDSLPQAPNLEYVGQQSYAQLPAVMAGFDVALMPFALNEATRSISPTKTLEYLAAGLPVVSTRVPDVVADYPEVVHLADTAAEFAEGCRAVVRHSASERDRRLRSIFARQEWDAIAAAMSDLIRPGLSHTDTLTTEAYA